MVRRAHLGALARSVTTGSSANSASAFASAPTTHDIVENNAAGTSVGIPVTDNDPDSDPLSYALESTNAASFEIVSTSGQTCITPDVTNDHVAKCNFAVRVEADDGAGTIPVTMNVTDLEETASTHPASKLDDLSNPHRRGLGDRQFRRVEKHSKGNTNDPHG